MPMPMPVTARPSPPPIRTAAGALAATAALLLAGCSSTPLSLRDNSAASGLVRATLRPAATAGGGALELEAQRVRGQGRQVLEAFDTVTVGGRSVVGPTTLQHEATAEHLHLVYHHRLFPDRPFEMAWFVGGAAGQLRWETLDDRTPATAPLRERQRWYGPTGGVSGRANLGAGLFLEARYAGAVIVSGADSGTREMGELALGWQALPALQLRAGLAESRVAMQPGGSSTELQFRARGPVVGLVLGF